MSGNSANTELRGNTMDNTREFHGLKQYNVGGVWKFNVLGFDGTYSGAAGTCEVETAEGGSRTVKIDAEDRLLIAGKLYGRERWTH
jgi:hypothetical protein